MELNKMQMYFLRDLAGLQQERRKKWITRFTMKNRTGLLPGDFADFLDGLKSEGLVETKTDRRSGFDYIHLTKAGRKAMAGIGLMQEERELLAAIAEMKSAAFGWKSLAEVNAKVGGIDDQGLTLAFVSLVNRGLVEYINRGEGDEAEMVRIRKAGRAML